jgi:tetratricopeptide (TPR) repeat protein
MKKPVTLMVGLIISLTLLAPLASARTVGLTTQAQAQDAAKEEAAIYKAFFDANNAKDHATALGHAKEYLKKFPTGTYATYLKGWIVQNRSAQFNEAMKTKNTAEMIRLGKEQLAEDPENLDYLYLLAVNIRTNEVFASPPNYANAADLSDFSQRAIKLIEGGKVPVVVPKENWKQGPILGMLYHNLALVETKNKNIDKAIEHYKKASSLDAANPAYYLAVGALHQEKYQTAVQKYQAIPEADRQAAEPKPEVKAALDEANSYADLVIDNWARFMALTVTSEPYRNTRAQVEKVLVDLYKYRHPDDADGLQKLIEQYKTSTPAGSPGKP